MRCSILVTPNAGKKDITITGRRPETAIYLPPRPYRKYTRRCRNVCGGTVSAPGTTVVDFGIRGPAYRPAFRARWATICPRYRWKISSSIALRGGFMGASVSSHQGTKLSLLEVSRGELPSHQSSTLEVHPPEMVRRRLADWASVQSETLQVLRRKPFDTSFKQNRHMLIAFDQGVRYDGETGVEGFPASTLRNYAYKMIFVPAGAR